MCVCPMDSGQGRYHAAFVSLKHALLPSVYNYVYKMTCSELSCMCSLGADMSHISHSSDIITNQTVSTAKEDL